MIEKVYLISDNPNHSMKIDVTTNTITFVEKLFKGYSDIGIEAL